MINIGVIGTGEVLDRFLVPALISIPDAQLWSVISRNKDRALTFASKHHAASPVPGFDNLDEFLHDPLLHAVIIATPDALHAKQAIAAALAGKHVFVEKPIATNVEDARRMIEHCQTAHVKLAVGYHHRWHLGHRWIKDYLQTNPDRDGINHFYAHWAYPAADLDDWRNDKDLGRWWSLAALGTHCAALCLWLLDDHGPITASQAITSSFATTKDHSAAITLRFDSSALAQIHVSFVSAYKKELALATDQYHIHCLNTLGPHGKGTISMYHAKERKEAAFITLANNPYCAELEDFVEAIEQDREPEVNGLVGLRNLEVLEQLTT